jgi:predicted nucleic acid-binding protein
MRVLLDTNVPVSHPLQPRSVKAAWPVLWPYALVGASDYLVTGDNDLPALAGQLPGLMIVSPSQFLTIWEDQPKP